MRSDKSRRRFVFLCVAPATILFFLFMILPTLNVFRMSLYERGAYSPNETFVGLKNFQHLLKDTQFIRSMQNMILLVVVVTIVTFAFALVFAAILTREKIKGQNFFRVIFYIPNILSVVVISGIFSAIYKPENGMLNSIIGLFRDMTDPILWKGEKLVIPSIILAMVWQAVGAVSIPVVGLGGILTGKDALEFIMAGAAAVQVGAANFANPRAMETIADEMAQWMDVHGVKTLEEIRGCARNAE